MEQLIQRLIEIGYSPNKAEELYNFYARNGDVDGLEDYLIAKEATIEIL